MTDTTRDWLARAIADMDQAIPEGTDPTGWDLERTNAAISAIDRAQSLMADVLVAGTAARLNGWALDQRVPATPFADLVPGDLLAVVEMTPHEYQRSYVVTGRKLEEHVRRARLYAVVRRTAKKVVVAELALGREFDPTRMALPERPFEETWGDSRLRHVVRLGTVEQVAEANQADPLIDGYRRSREAHVALLRAHEEVRVVLDADRVERHAPWLDAAKALNEGLDEHVVSVTSYIREERPTLHWSDHAERHPERWAMVLNGRWNTMRITDEQYAAATKALAFLIPEGA